MKLSLRMKTIAVATVFTALFAPCAFAQDAPAPPAPQTSAALISQASDLEKTFQWADAAKCYAQAADLDLPQHPLQAAAGLDHEADDEEKQSHHGAATTLYTRALAMQRDGQDLAGQAKSLLGLAMVDTAAGKASDALPLLATALPLSRSANAPTLEANVLRRTGIAYRHLSRPSKALEEYSLALPLFKATGDSHGQASTLVNIGSAYDDLSQPSKALEEYALALPLIKAAGDTDGQASVFDNIGNAYLDLSRPSKALEEYALAMTLHEAAGDTDGQANALNNIGLAYHDLSQPSKSLKEFALALTLHKVAGNIGGQGGVLINIGNAYRDLSQPSKALKEYALALPLFKAVGDTDGQATACMNTGNAYLDLSQPSKALEEYALAMTLHKAAGDTDGQASVFDNIGNTYLHLSQPSKALKEFALALSLLKAAGDTDGQASVFDNIGNAYLSLHQPSKALEEYTLALPMLKAAGDKDFQAETLGNLMKASAKLPRRAKLAVLYGKQSVNLYQTVRSGLSSLDATFQQSYLKYKEPTYRYLADLLIRQHRLTEAQQVLHLLKEREFFDFLNPDADAPTPTMDKVPLTKREAHWTAAYDNAAQPWIALTNQAQTLTAKQQRTPQEEKQLTNLKTRIAAATTKLNAVQPRTVAAFSGQETADDALPQTSGAQDVQRALPRGTVALYTIVSPDRLDLILITHDRQKAYQSPITSDALYCKVYALRRALADPNLDPRPLAADLYRLVLGPVQRDLDTARPNTILFSLDDALRYIPPAVLYDPKTKQYMTERYRTELVSLADAASAPAASRPLSVLGMGVTTAQDGDPALPGVAAELSAIVHEPGDTGGLLPGRRLLDGRFTRTAMEDGLKSRGYPLVHLASHFALDKTQDASYLLLGDGTHLSVSELGKDPHRFRGVTLLTLSACETAMEVRGGSGGREVEGVGALAQSLGAGSVLASLWPVSDEATPPLMTALYGYIHRHPAAPLAAALQAAQLSLLHKPMPASGDRAMRGTASVSIAPAAAKMASFVSDKKAPYAHPYYWAPFILIGKGK